MLIGHALGSLPRPPRPPRGAKRSLSPISDTFPLNQPVSSMPVKPSSKPSARGLKPKYQASFRAAPKRQKPVQVHFQRADRLTRAGPSSLTQMIRNERAKQLGTENRRTVGVKPQLVTEPHPRSPTTVTMPRKSILKNPAVEGTDELPDGYRPAITIEEKYYSYKPDEIPLMQNQRAITTISIPKHFTMKPKTCLPVSRCVRSRCTRREKERWERNVFLSDCGQFVIIHEYPAYDWHAKQDILGKIVIYRTFAKVAVMNEDLPQFDYGRSRERVVIPGMEGYTGSGGTGSDAPYYFSAHPKQSQWATDPQIVAEWKFPPNEIVSQVKVSMDVGKAGDGNV